MRNYLATSPSSYDFMSRLALASGDTPEDAVHYRQARQVPPDAPATLDAAVLAQMTRHEYAGSRLRGADVQGLDALAARWYAHYLTTLPTDRTLVVWNGKPLQIAAAVAAARTHGSRVVFIENGLLPGTLAFDTQGINESSFLAKLTWYPHQDDAALDAVRGWPLTQRPNASECSHVADDPLPARYLLYLAQVHHDTQITTASSPAYPSVVAGAVAAGCAASELRIPLVIKLHPNDLEWGLATFRAAVPQAHLVVHEPLAWLIEKSSLVVTINSSAGFEARLRGKPVLALGQTMYWPAVASNTRPSQLTAQMADLLDTTPADAGLVEYCTELVHYLVPVGGADDPRRFRKYHQRLRLLEEGLFDHITSLAARDLPRSLCGVR